jgi:ribosomal-protein-alanine N-acetyltransferase
MELSTNRLFIREYEDPDIQAILRYLGDPEVVRYLPFGPSRPEDAENFLRRVAEQRQSEPRRDFEVAVTLREGGRLIGGVRISTLNPGQREGSIGYVLDRDFWSRGYGTEAA